MAKKRDRDPLLRGGAHKDRLPGYYEAKERGILSYRIVEPKPGRYVRIAITKEKGPRGGRTVATSIIKKGSG